MGDTQQLIEQLSADAKTEKGLADPVRLSLLIVLAMLAYGFGAAMLLGLRAEPMAQFASPWFAAEIMILSLLMLSSTGAAIYSLYPDAHQQALLMKLPYTFFLLLTGLIMAQLLIVHEIPVQDPHAGMGCVLCGASVHPRQAGSYAVLAAAAAGCVVIRFIEVADMPQHLLLYHYLPTFAFALLGALLGKRLLKW